MLASRVGVIGAFVAVLVLSAELVGAVALRHHIVGDVGAAHVANVRDAEQQIRNSERDARRALEDAITVRKGLGDATQEDPAAERMRHDAEREERLDDQLLRDEVPQVPNRAGY
jgi:hypothetical protein